MRHKVLELSDKLLHYLKKQPQGKLWKPANRAVNGVVDDLSGDTPRVTIEFTDDTTAENTCSLEYFMHVNNLTEDDLV